MGTVAIYQRLVVAGGGFFLLLDLGPGAAACGMGIEINTGYSCYLSAARRRRGRFFLLLDLGPEAAAGGMGLEITRPSALGMSDPIWGPLIHIFVDEKKKCEG